jgi:hypothetical protein
MKTVQLAIRDSEYAQSLRSSLLRDGTHRVYVVDRPDLRLDGVVVIDGSKFDSLSVLGDQPERFVVLTRKGIDSLSRLWNAGIRHVLFEGDSPNTAQLAIIAAELRLPSSGVRAGKMSGLPSESHHTSPRASLAVLGPSARCGRCRFTSSDKYGFKGCPEC